MGQVNADVTVEFTFSVEANYEPGGPATPPSYDSGGDPAYGPEWDLENILSITFSRYVFEDGKRVAKDFNLLDAIKGEDKRKAFVDTFIEAIHGSKLEEDFGEAIHQEAIED